MAIQVRTIDVSELADWITCKDVGFLHQRDELDEYARYFSAEIDLDRTWAALDGGDRVVGTLRSFLTHLTVPGNPETTASALTNVTVAPTHRRRGLLTEMITGDLTASARRGEPLAILIASEYPIYGRFGFGAAAESAAYEVDTTAANFAEGGGTSAGTVELVDLGTLRKEAPPLYENFRLSRPGAISRDDNWWDHHLHQVEVPGEGRPKGYSALYRSPSGAPEGFLRYRGESSWQEMRPRGTLLVDELVSLTPAAYETLWRFCCEVDLITTVRASDRATQEALPWLLVDGRAVRQTMRYDFLWVRILDVCAALSARSYTVDATVVLEVTDPLGFAAGTYLLEGGPDGASCVRTDAPAELTLPVDVLGSVYLGGMPLALVAAGGRVRESRPGVIGKADLMLRSAIVPWCSTWF